MKIECEKDLLISALTHAGRCSGKHPTLPVLSAVVCESAKNTLRIKATNLDIGVVIEIPAKVYEEGVIAVPPAVLSSLLSNTNEKKITLEEKNGNLQVVAGPNKKTTIKCLPMDDFPTIPSVSEGETVFCDANVLVKGIEAVVFSASASEIKPELSSVYIYPEQNTLTFVATDSFRLAEKKIHIKGIKDFHGIIVPYKNANEIARIFTENDKPIEIMLGQHHITLKGGGTYVVSRLIDGNFPDYKQIIPKEETAHVVVLKQDMIQAIKIANVFANKFNQITLRVDAKTKQFILESKNADIGESAIPIDAAVSGEALDLNVNNRYFADCLPSIHQDSLSVSFVGQGRPVVIQGVNDTSFTYLVMPMNR